jgi:hypothetical protein
MGMQGLQQQSEARTFGNVEKVERPFDMTSLLAETKEGASEFVFKRE